MPLDESLAMATVMQEVRRQIGVRYPTDPPDDKPRHTSSWRAALPSVALLLAGAAVGTLVCMRRNRR